MGVFDKIKRRLPIVGAGGGEPAPAQTARPPATAPQPPTPPAAPARATDAQGFIEEFVKGHPIALFMKGSPASPMCGFSANVAAILGTYGHDIAHVDVLLDPEIRQGVKVYSSWPTIPQIYVGGEFLGGADIVQQMHQSGELAEVISTAMEGGGPPSAEG
jgi:monothiol glutaredoxin